MVPNSAAHRQTIGSRTYGFCRPGTQTSMIFVDSKTQFYDLRQITGVKCQKVVGFCRNFPVREHSEPQNKKTESGNSFKDARANRSTISPHHKQSRRRRANACALLFSRSLVCMTHHHAVNKQGNTHNTHKHRAKHSATFSNLFFLRSKKNVMEMFCTIQCTHTNTA